MRAGGSLGTLQGLIEAQLSRIDQENQRRRLRPRPAEGQLDLTHNDYLGLGQDFEFQKRARTCASDWPIGSGASRLLGGEHRIFQTLEEAFSAFKASESALYFPSGYAANLALMRALNLGDAVFFSDELNHASIIDGMRLAKIQSSQKRIFPHNDLKTLSSMLEACRAKLKIVVVESLYGMEGDFCPAQDLVRLCKRYEAVLVVDEAHALGVYGSKGQGWMDEQGIDPQQYISVNPCGKALAASGAMICGPLCLRDYLINTARSFIFTTAPSPWQAAALLESLRTVERSDATRARLRFQVSYIRAELEKFGFECGPSASHIIPIILGSETQALAAEEFCQKHGLLIRAIRPPTVPRNRCRLRLAIHAGLNQADMQRLLEILKELYDEISINLSDRH